MQLQQLAALSKNAMGLTQANQAAVLPLPKKYSLLGFFLLSIQFYHPKPAIDWMPLELFPTSCP